MSIIVPRNYQDAAWRSVWEYFSKGVQGNPLIALPTGTGKSIVIALLLLAIFKRYRTQRVMVLTHVKELIEQNHAKLLDVWPGAPAGIYSSGLGRADLGYPITFGGIASVHKRAHQFGHIDIILIDEAHLVSNNGNTMYINFINNLKLANPYLKVVGLTATPYRLSTGMLTDVGGIFTDIVFDLTNMEGFNWLIDQGYIVEAIPRPTKVKIDLDNVPIVGHEFVLRNLQETIKKQDITWSALQEAVTIGSDRSSWICFSTGVEDAIESAEMLRDMGIEAKAIHSSNSKYKMKDAERDKIIEEFKHGDIQCAVNNNMLTTGFDHPPIDLIIGLRPTMSVSMWVQMVGRGTRPVFDNANDYDLTTKQGRLDCIANSSKQNCLVLDYARNTSKLGPINNPNLPIKKKGSKSKLVSYPSPYKECDNCMSFVHCSVRICPECGNPFELEVKIDSFASSDALIEKLPDFSTPILTDFKLDHMTYTRHRKEGKPDSMCVTYFAGARSFKVFICLEHEGYAKNKASAWWAENYKGDMRLITIPKTVTEALEVAEEKLKVPTHIYVNMESDYPRVVRTEIIEGTEQPTSLIEDNTGPIVRIEFEDDDIPF